MTDKNDKKKYLYTKQLVRIAASMNYSPSDIAEKAGLSRKSTSQVSKWRNGISLATVRQMQYFINEYGHLLKRKMEHLFYTIEEKDGAPDLNFLKLNGDVILKHQVCHTHTLSNRILKTALLRLVVLKENEHFHLITQSRAGLDHSLGFILRRDLPNFIHSSNEEANWFAYDIAKRINAEHLLELIDKYAYQLSSGENPAKKAFQNDAISLKFIIRQSLLKQGFKSQDIIDVCSENEIINEPNKPKES
ncbi:hypothetical protein [Photobacterium chitinilyticum]|uniref:hypothetical protein n=1 Tax=Photobacterium chitinilyticum TaxID=2485123 RepID=UPI003D14B88F